MKVLLKFFAGIFIIILMGMAALMIDATPGSAGSAERKLVERARTALGVEAATSSALEMDGQKAILTGEAASAEARNAIIERVAHADGAGGLLLGGVTAIDASRLTVAQPSQIASPFVFVAELDDGVLSFSGAVPDQATRDAIYRSARDLFQEATINSDLEIAAGAPVETTIWANAAEASLHALSYLQSGRLSAEDSVFTLAGEAVDETRAAAAKSLVDDLPIAISGAAEIAVAAPPQTIEDLILRSVDRGQEPSPSSAVTESEEDAAVTADTAPATPAPAGCLSALQDIIDARRIGFSSARADIDNASRDHLREISAALNDCPAARLNITGHTDSSGNPARNRQLSGYRADAVRAFLISVGAPADRLSASGAGSAEPLTSNTTPAGRARNRRIEIEVIPSE